MNDSILIQVGNTYNLVIKKYCIKNEEALASLVGDPPLSRAYLVDEATGAVDCYIVSFDGNWIKTTGTLDLGIL